MNNLQLLFKTIVTLFFLTLTINSSAQCTVTISPDPIVIECGESVDLSALGLSTVPALSTTFNGGAIGPGWSSSSVPDFTNPCGPTLDGTPAAWFGDVPMPRTLTTNGFDLSCGGQVCFELDFAADDAGGGSHCEDPDQADEGVFFQYSIDGGVTWVDVFYFNPQPNYPGPYYDWADYCFTIPPAAWSSNTMFQWDQPNATTTVNDHWGIDNVSIYPTDCSFWYDWSNIPGTPDVSTQTVSPLTTTTYTVDYTNGIDVCSADVTVVVNSMIVDVNAASTSLGCNDCTDLDVVLVNSPSNICQESASQNGLDANNTTASIIGFPCVPNGASITSVLMDGYIGNVCTGWYDYDIVIDGVTVLTGQCNQTNLDLSSFLPFSAVEIVSNDNDNYPDGITMELILNISYSTSPVYAYSWSPSTGLNDATISNPLACPTVSTNYFGTITEINSGCSASDNVMITVPVGFNVNSGNIITPCIGMSDGTAEVTATAGSAPYDYVWVNSSGMTIYTDNNNNGTSVATGLFSDTYTVTVTDNNGCIEVVNVVVTNTPCSTPTFVHEPSNVTVACIGDVPVTVNLAWSDGCAGAGTAIGIDGTLIGGPCGGTITRTWSYTNSCGNSASVSQIITINDNIAPVFNAIPADITVQCYGDVPVITDLVWTDNCDGTGSVVGVEYALVGDYCGGTITRTWSYTDACGNNTTEYQVITIDDSTLPTASNPLPQIGLPPAFDATQVTDEADNCGIPTVTFGGDVSNGLLCPEIITRTYVVTDACGNYTSVFQTYTITDNINPTASNPAPINVECIGDVPVPNPLDVIDEADNVVIPVVTWVDDVSDGNSCPETILRRYYVVDGCGNFIYVTQTIIVNDDQVPTASNPATITVSGSVPAVDVNVVIDEVDNCTVTPIVLFMSESSDGGICPETITRIYSVTDDCGNTINVTHTIIVIDSSLPTASNPLPVNVECIGDVPAQDPLVVIDEADNQGAPIVAWVSDVSDGNSCPEIITRTYSVTDICGGFIHVTQTITINDVTPPVASNLASVNVECIEDVPSSDINHVIGESDNCTAVPSVVFISDVSNNGSCPEIITRTYQVSDDCGNTTDVTQIITVLDVTAPVASNLIAVNVECAGDVPVPNVNDVIGETDNCLLAPIVTFVSDVSDGNSCPEIITRTYQVSDGCNNYVYVNQIITVNDVTPPLVDNPVSISVPGALDVPAPNINHVVGETDNCTLNPVVAFVSEVSDGNVCNEEKITRTYSVTDDCGNQTIVTHVITILAVTPPISANDIDVCENDSVVLIANNPMGVPVSWDNGVVNAVPFSTNISMTYTVTADNHGCIAVADATVTMLPIPTVQFFGDELSGCAPLYVNFVNQSTSSLSLVECTWEVEGASDLLYGFDSLSYIFPNGGTYDVMLTATSSNGCSNSLTYADYIYVEGKPVADFSASSTTVSTLNTEVYFTNESINATDYEWSFGDANTIAILDPSHVFPDETSGNYVVQLKAYSPLRCKDSAQMVITVEEELIFYVPNAFTPDGDSYNNTFQPQFTSGYDPYDFHMTIFNRWGDVLFETFDADYGWNGMYNGVVMQDGTYIWKIECRQLKDGERLTKSGHVSILR